MSERSLDGQWRFRCPHALRGGAPKGVRVASWMPATMPGTIHFNLQKAGKIADPLYGRNELDVQWVDQQDWELSRWSRSRRAMCVARDKRSSLPRSTP